MPNFLAGPPPPEPIKMLYLGHTGSGKTGSLAALAAAGYNVRILDMDKGCQILGDYLTNPESPYLKPKAGLWSGEGTAQRLSYVTVTERYAMQGAKTVARGDAWQRMIAQLNNWRDGELQLGNISKWGERDVLVIDGLSRAAEAALNMHLVLNGRILTGPQVGTAGTNDYTAVYRMITDWLDMLKSEDIKCQIIMICHIQFQDAPGTDPKARSQSDLKGFPQVIGRLIAPKIGQYFNHALQAVDVGGRRFIRTKSLDSVGTKSSAPLRVKDQYDLSTGLAEYFQAILGPVVDG